VHDGAVSSSVGNRIKGASSVAKSATEKKSGDNAIVRYFRETWYELRRVSWPTRSEAANLTLIVIAVTTFLAIVLGLMDWVFSSAFDWFLKLV